MEDKVFSNVAKAIEKWPESKAHAFYFKESPGVKYFILELKRIGIGNLRSIAKCLVLDTNKTDLYEDTVQIRTESNICDMTFREFGELVKKIYLSLECQGCSKSARFINFYHKHGF